MSITPEVQAQIDEAVTAATEALAANNQKLTKELKNARAKIKEEIDPEAHTALQTQVDELKDQLSKATKKSETTIKDLTKQLEGEKGFTHKMVVENGLTEAAIKAGVLPKFLPAVTAMLKGQVVVVDDNGNRIAKIGDKTIAEYLPTWAQTDEGKHYIAAQNNNGGGGQGGGGGNGAGDLKRGTMTDVQKVAYLKEHGQEKYNALPQ